MSRRASNPQSASPGTDPSTISTPVLLLLVQEARLQKGYTPLVRWTRKGLLDWIQVIWGATVPTHVVEEARAVEKRNRKRKNPEYRVRPGIEPANAKKGDRIVDIETYTGGNGTTYNVTFGFASADDAGRFEFRVSRERSSATFKTAAGARRAADAWIHRKNPMGSYRGVPYTASAGVYRLRTPQGTVTFSQRAGGIAALRAYVDRSLQ